MKKLFVTTILGFVFCNIIKAQKGINLAIQLNTQAIKYTTTTTTIDRGTGIGIGVNLIQKLGPLQLAIDPMFMTYSHRTNNNSKIQYIQVPVSINLLSFSKRFVDDEVHVGSVKAFNLGLNVGIYGAYAIGGKFGGGKMQFGESITDDRSPFDFGLHTKLSFGANSSSFKGYIQVQRGMDNVIPSASINNNSRKLNAVNVGASFKIKTKK